MTTTLTSIVLPLASVFIAFCLLIVTAVQACIYRRQNHIMATQARLARTSIEASKESSERQLRAYIGLKISDKHPAVVPAGSGYLEVIIKNNGLTPAHQIRAKGRVGAMDAELPNNFEIEKIDPKKEPSRFVLGPQQEIPVKCYLGGNLTPVGSSRREMYIITRVEYVDAFDKPRFTTLCFTWQNGVCRPCEYGNDAD